MTTEKIAVPASTGQSLDSPLSAHFGHCPAFIVASIEDGKIGGVEVVRNGAHSSCAEPIDRLARHGVKVLIASGMGMRPYMHAQRVGISVVKAVGSTVREAMESYIQGKSSSMDSGSLCSGGRKH